MPWLIIIVHLDPMALPAWLEGPLVFAVIFLGFGLLIYIMARLMR